MADGVMTYDRPNIEGALLLAALNDRAHAQLIISHLRVTDWDATDNYNAIKQIAKHGRVVDQNLNGHPESECPNITSEDVEILCWHLVAIRAADDILMVLRISERNRWDHLRDTLTSVVTGTLERLEREP